MAALARIHDTTAPSGRVVQRSTRERSTHIMRFLAVGAVCTATYTLMYCVFSVVMPDLLAHTIATVVTTWMNTALNGRHTFNVVPTRTHQSQGLVVGFITWAFTLVALGALHAINPEASTMSELVTLTIANLIGTGIRYVLLRSWVFQRRR